MKIYKVVYGDGSTRSIWTGYRSATGSAAQSRDGKAHILVAHVPDELWQPVNRAEESRLARLENLWHGLSVEDAEVALGRLQEALVRRQQWQARTAPTLGDSEKREAAALLGMEQLSNAKA